MNRSSRWRRTRRSDSISSARARRRTLGAPAPAVTAIPDATRQLSDGLIIDASVVARLLGIRLLTLDASLTVSPARIKAPVADYASVRRSSTHPTGPPGRIGARLASAEQSIDEGAATLAATLRARYLAR